MRSENLKSSLTKSVFGLRLKICQAMAPPPPLFLASCNGDIEKVKQLLRREGTKVNQRNKHGVTPLLAAAQKGHDNVVEVLLEEQAIIVNLADKDGDTPLSMAVKNGHVKVVKLLLQRDEIKLNNYIHTQG